MNTLLQADIFFFISSIGFTFIAIGAVIATYYIARAAQEVECLAREVREEVDDLAEDIDDLREKLSSKAWFVAKFLEALTSASFFKKVTKHTREED